VQMSAEGNRVAAVGAGTLYVSSDYGVTWAARTAPAAWASVHMSDDGQRITALGGGSVYTSVDGGLTFTIVPGTANTDWRAIAGSADGMRLVAAASLYNGDATRQGVYVSTDGGATWTRRVGNGNWTFAASSADGQRMAVLDNGGTPWVSDDGGATFTSRFSYSGWSGLAISRDGGTVAAQEPRNDTYGHRGYVFISPGGNDPWEFRAGDLNLTWRGISLSSDGNWFAGADNGVLGTAGGKIYISSGNRTAGGTIGSITGGQGQMVEVTYQGNGRFSVSNYAGGPFTIR
jgi:hypothetical protein